MNIYLTGAHGTGKTTIADATEGFNQKPSVSRQSPYEMGSLEHQRYVMKKVYKDCISLDGYCLTRTPLDVASYTSLYHPKELKYDSMQVEAFRRTDPLLFYIPIEFSLEDDGVRPGAEEQKFIDTAIMQWIQAYDFRYVRLTGTVEQRVKLIKENVYAPL